NPMIADSDEAGRVYRREAGHPLRFEAGHGYDLKPATGGFSAGREIDDVFELGWGQAHCEVLRVRDGLNPRLTSRWPGRLMSIGDPLRVPRQ
ncbi:MAG: hypothetical protein J2P53_16820, partial [Bradyrhizobiaceae bacterium]|nr:hypothetical protein [Bradyrhizobiaceae bacterium]